MSNPRQEFVFKVGARELPLRPTLKIVAKVEARFGALPAIIRRMASSEFQMMETAELLFIIGGGPKESGPALEQCQDHVFDNYYETLIQLGQFLSNAMDGAPVPTQAAE